MSGMHYRRYSRRCKDDGKMYSVMPCIIDSLQEFIEKTQYQKSCDKTLQEFKIKVAGIKDWIGNIVAYQI